MSKDIRAYNKKRDFSRTPEPRPKKRPRKATDPVFVVHRHEARRLHYDLRLEVGGVLKSFAVPKGFSFDPKDKHLAVRTEDHPLEYEHFDGVIPQGQSECGLGKARFWLVQTRASDEPETKFFKCEKCKHTWRDYGLRTFLNFRIRKKLKTFAKTVRQPHFIRSCTKKLN